MSLLDILGGAPTSISGYLTNTRHATIGYFDGSPGMLNLWSPDSKLVTFYSEEMRFSPPHASFGRTREYSIHDSPDARQINDTRGIAEDQLSALCQAREIKFDGLYFLRTLPLVGDPIPAGSRSFVIDTIADFWDNGLGKHSTMVLDPRGLVTLYTRAKPAEELEKGGFVDGTYQALYEAVQVLLTQDFSAPLPPPIESQASARKRMKMWTSNSGRDGNTRSEKVVSH